MDILYGRNPVLEALRAGRTSRKIVIADGVRPERRLEEILQLAKAAGVVVEHATRHKLDDIAHTDNHQGVAGYFHARPPMALDELIGAAKVPGLIVVLDGIQDPQNLGAIVRCADGAGADGVVIARQNATAVTPAAAKSSAGATEYLPIATVANIAQGLDVLGGAGYWRIGLDGGGDSVYDEVDLTVPLALVIGAEGRGLGALTRKKCDVIASLPMAGHVESLNAAAASAVILYEVARQRRRQ